MSPRFDAIGLVVSDVAASVAFYFYRRLGFAFAEGAEGEPHSEAQHSGGLRLLLDTEDTVRSFHPRPVPSPRPPRHARPPHRPVTNGHPAPPTVTPPPGSRLPAPGSRLPRRTSPVVPRAHPVHPLEDAGKA